MWSVFLDLCQGGSRSDEALSHQRSGIPKLVHGSNTSQKKLTIVYLSSYEIL